MKMYLCELGVNQSMYMYVCVKITSSKNLGVLSERVCRTARVSSLFCVLDRDIVMIKPL